MRPLTIMSLLTVLLASFVLPITPNSLAQDSQDNLHYVHINFENAPFDETCQNYINQYAGVYASSENQDAAGVPFVVDMGSGLACGFVSTSQMRIHLAQPADAIAVLYDGDMALEFQLNGQYVTNIEASNATRGLYERNLRYDELIFNSNGFSDLHLYSLEFGFAFAPVTTLSENFNGATAGIRCVDYLREQDWIAGDSSDLPGPLIMDTATAGQSVPECELGANESLSILFAEPMQYAEFWVSGALEISLRLDSKPITPVYTGFGPFLYQQFTLAHFNEIQVSTGEFGVRIDNLTFAAEKPAGLPLLMTELAVNSNCVDVFNQFDGIIATASSTTNFAIPQVTWDETHGISCEFNPGNSLQMNFATPLKTLGFWIYGGADVEFWQNGTLLETVNVGGLPVYYGRTFPNGIDEIHFTESSGFSSFHLSDIQYQMQE